MSIRNNKSVEQAALNIPALLRRGTAAFADSSSLFNLRFNSSTESTGLPDTLLEYAGGGAVTTVADGAGMPRAIETDEDEVGMPRALASESRSISSAGDFTSFVAVERETDADGAAGGTAPDDAERGFPSAVDGTTVREVVGRETDAGPDGGGTPPESEERSIASALARIFSRDVSERETDPEGGGYAICGVTMTSTRR